MKKIQCIVIMMLIYQHGFSQANDISVSKIDSTGAGVQTLYCELVGTSNLLGTKVNVEIDMGQSTGFLNLNAAFIKDESTGKFKKFNSMIDAMNFMGNLGWEFVQAYAVTFTNNTSVYHYLLKQTLIKGKNGYYPEVWTRNKKPITTP